jgi:alpha-L-fucosidase
VKFAPGAFVILIASASAFAQDLPAPPPIPEPTHAAASLPDKIVATPGPFQPTAESLKEYMVPEWFRDAKFGIWSHWGPQSVPQGDGWYARNMYVQGSQAYNYHVAHYGHPSVFGFKDIIQLWTAEKFDPERLMDLYAEAGAKYFVTMGAHHDNFDLWDSKYHAWNAVNYGPHRDIVSLWREAALKRGLRFGVSEHFSRSYSWFNTSHDADKTGPKAGVPYDGSDPRFADLYYKPHTDSRVTYPVNAPEVVQRDWFYRMQDLMDRYHPDLLYSDGAIPFGAVGRQFLANFYNANATWHGGKLEAVYNIKDIPAHGEYIDGAAVLDMERARLGRIWPAPWQTDETTGDWFYKTGVNYQAEALSKIQMLVDIVSKNGCLLLNITQRPDGSLDPEAERMLHDMGRWMKVNGEAIYGTRPWKIYGEGPDGEGVNGVSESANRTFTAQDIRFTTKGDTLYAIALGRPAGPFTVDSVRVDSVAADARIELLGCGPVTYRVNEDEQLVITPPAHYGGDYAFTFRLTGFKTSLHTSTRLRTPMSSPSP